MVVIANATTYGTGVVINPNGDLSDDLFEVVIVKKISFGELFKMRFSHKPFHPRKTEVFQTSTLKISTTHHVHFQVDGEYLGKLYSVNAEIIPEAVTLIVPADEKKGAT
jgi:diacylglycerol kinase family enzyme